MRTSARIHLALNTSTDKTDPQRTLVPNRSSHFWQNETNSKAQNRHARKSPQPKRDKPLCPTPIIFFSYRTFKSTNSSFELRDVLKSSTLYLLDHPTIAHNQYYKRTSSPCAQVGTAKSTIIKQLDRLRYPSRTQNLARKSFHVRISLPWGFELFGLASNQAQPKETTKKNQPTQLSVRSHRPFAPPRPIIGNKQQTQQSYQQEPPTAASTRSVLEHPCASNCMPC